MLNLDEELLLVPVAGKDRPEAGADDVHGHHISMRRVGNIPREGKVLLEALVCAEEEDRIEAQVDKGHP